MSIRRVENLSDTELAELDQSLDRRLRDKGSKAFSETALSGLTRGYPGLLVERQIQRNQLAQTGGKLQAREDEIEALLSSGVATPPEE